jgi:hypothetical protein
MHLFSNRVLDSETVLGDYFVVHFIFAVTQARQMVFDVPLSLRRLREIFK